MKSPPHRRPGRCHGHRPRSCPGARCSTASGTRAAPVGVRRPAEPAPGLGGSLSTFYAQRCKWSRLRGRPVRHPRGARRLRQRRRATPSSWPLVKVPASEASKRIGSLVVNPGGPGGSGVGYAQRPTRSPAGLRARYDVVGFDPRGVGEPARRSTASPTPARPLHRAARRPTTPPTQLRDARRSPPGCATRARVVQTVGTHDAAKDMDILRSALGDKKLDLPRQVLRHAASARPTPSLFPTASAAWCSTACSTRPHAELLPSVRPWASSAPTALRAYCVSEGGCPLGESVDDAWSGCATFLGSVDAIPLPRTGDKPCRGSPSWASLGIAAAMYDQGQWRDPADAMRDALGGRRHRADAARRPVRRPPPGRPVRRQHQRGDLRDQLSRQPTAATVAERRAAAQVAEGRARPGARSSPWSSLTCGVWPGRPTGRAEDDHRGRGAPPIVVIGTTRDPATPYEWAVALRDQLADASLITCDGDGHTAYPARTAASTTPSTPTYLEGTVPEDGLHCSSAEPGRAPGRFAVGTLHSVSRRRARARSGARRLSSVGRAIHS